MTERYDRGDGRPWDVVSDREPNVRRRGFGVDNLRETLEALRRRGDVSAQYEWTDESTGWKKVDLRQPNLLPRNPIA